MSETPLPDRGVAAHRGASATHPENTVEAFREAVRLGAAMVELDLRRTADGEIVVLHDKRVDRTTDGEGLVSELTFAEIRRLDAGRHRAADFAGARVPTLDEVLDALPRDVWINVQVKHGESVSGEAARRIVAKDRLHQAFIACGNAAAREARAVHPDVLICNLVRKESRAAYVDHCRNTGANFLQLHWARGLPEPEIVEAAERAGLRVNFFCDPERPRVRRVWRAGVHFPLVDDVERARRKIEDP